MKLIIQRVEHALVTVEDKVISRIGNGLLVLVGIGNDDTKEIADKMLQKLLKLRIFSDESGKTNLCITDVKGQLMIISQFTLYADCKKGNRPSFMNAGAPMLANELYEYMLKKAGEYSVNVPFTPLIGESPEGRPMGALGSVVGGSFGSDMKVELLNDGPFTIILDSSEIF